MTHWSAIPATWIWLALSLGGLAALVLSCGALLFRPRWARLHSPGWPMKSTFVVAAIFALWVVLLGADTVFGWAPLLLGEFNAAESVSWIVRAVIYGPLLVALRSAARRGGHTGS